jgi:hypothetical protein
MYIGGGSHVPRTPLEIQSLVPRPTMDLGTRIGAAGLGLGAFTTTKDLIEVCKGLYEIWHDFKNLDEDADLLRTKLILQQDLLGQWQRDWYAFPVTGRASIGRLRFLEQHDRTVQATLQSINSQLEKIKPMSILQMDQTTVSQSDHIRWVAGQKEMATATLNNVESLLAGLIRLLPLQSQNPDAALMVIAMGHSEDDSTKTSVRNMLQTRTKSEVIQATLGLRSLDESLRTALERRVKDFQTTNTGSNLKQQALRDRITSMEPDVSSAGSRSFCHFDGRPAVIEWKKYDSRWQGQKGIELRGRIDNIAQLLNTTTKPAELLTLHCEGYFDEAQDSRYGFVFTSRESSGDNLISLKKLLDEPTVELLPTLEHRYQIAYAVGRSIAILHTAGWLHKSIRSQNVLFNIKEGKVLWERPYLVGFEFSRPDKPDASSEKPEQSARFNLYRHRSAQGDPNESYRKEFDLYSFGVVLLEIGLWRSAWSWRKEGMTPMRFYEALLDLTSQKLAHFMGVEYRDATKKCLNGELSLRGIPILKSFFIEVVEELGRCLDT